MKLLHTMIRVINIEKSLKFYQEVLGLKLVRSMEVKKVGATLYFLTDETGNYELELTYNHKLPEGGYSHGSHFGHLAVGVNDMDKFSGILRANGLEYSREPFMITESGPKIAFIADPDGITIEIIEKR